MLPGDARKKYADTLNENERRKEAQERKVPKKNEGIKQLRSLLTEES